MTGRETGASIRGARTAAWATLAIAVLAKVVILALPLSWRTETVLSDTLTYLLPMAVVAGVAIVAPYRRVMSDRERVVWVLAGSAIALVLVSEAYWTWYAVAIDPLGPEPGSWIRVPQLIAVGMLAVALTRMSRFGDESVLVRVRIYLDLLAIFAVAWPFLYLYGTLPLLGEHPRGGVVGAAVAALYPLCGLTILWMTSSIALGRGMPKRPAWERLVATSLSVYAVGLTLFPVLQVVSLESGDYGSGWLTTVLGIGVLLMFVGQVYRLTDETPDFMAPWPLPGAVSERILRYNPVLAAVGLVLTGALVMAKAGESTATPLVVALVIGSVLLTLRSWISAVERAHIRAVTQVDPETGAFAGRFLEPRLAEVVEYSLEAGRESSLVVFGTTGLLSPLGIEEHSQGALRRFAQAVREESPPGADLFRLSEDRFAVVLEGTGPQEASAFALRVWMGTGRDRARAARGAAPSGLCAGVAAFPEHATDSERLLSVAEVALWAARGAEEEPVAVYEEAMAKVSPDEHSARERMRAVRSTVRALAQAVDARDPATRDHSSNVAELATALAQVLGLNDRQVQIIGLGALMHDVGKIGVRDEVLLKPGLLDASERREIREHAELGERILAPARLDDILPLVRWHHERWDGTGYPDGLAGNDIPVEARVLAICDAFETMTTGRPYADARSVEEALAEVESCASTQFDPDMVAAFVRMVRGLGAHGIFARPETPGD